MEICCPTNLMKWKCVWGLIRAKLREGKDETVEDVRFKLIYKKTKKAFTHWSRTNINLVFLLLFETHNLQADAQVWTQSASTATTASKQKKTKPRRNQTNNRWIKCSSGLIQSRFVEGVFFLVDMFNRRLRYGSSCSATHENDTFIRESMKICPV